MLVLSDNALNNAEKDYKAIQELRDNTLHTLEVSEPEEHSSHVEQYEGAGDGQDALG